MSEIGLTPKDNELRMQVGFKLTHEAEHRLYVVDKDGNWMCPMGALKELLALVRDDERKKCVRDYLQDTCNAIDLVRIAEREACAKIADDLERKEYEAIGDPRVPQFKSLIGKAIRARGNE